MRILIDENAMRLKSDAKWMKLARKLSEMGHNLMDLPRNYHGASDSSIVKLVKENYDGIITEDRDFVEAHRNNAYHEIINAGKIILLVQRVPSTSSNYEFRVFKYDKYGKKELFRIHS